MPISPQDSHSNIERRDRSLHPSVLIDYQLFPFCTSRKARQHGPTYLALAQGVGTHGRG